MKPPPDRHWYLVSYDVSDDKRRVKVAKCLEGYGERLQFSVFRTFLSGRSLARLRWELSRKMAPEDGLLVIHLCPSCQARVEDRRGKRDWRQEAPVGFRIAGSAIMHPPTLEAPEADVPVLPDQKPSCKRKRSVKGAK